MGKYIPENIEKEILSINWFSKLGKPVTQDNVVLEKQLSKVNQSINSVEWENITLEESNNMNAYFYKKNLFSEQEEWDFIAEEGRVFINNNVIPMIPEIDEINNLSVVLLKTIGK